MRESLFSCWRGHGVVIAWSWRGHRMVMAWSWRGHGVVKKVKDLRIPYQTEEPMTFNPSRYEQIYGIHLLDDVHNLLATKEYAP